MELRSLLRTGTGSDKFYCPTESATIEEDSILRRQYPAADFTASNQG